MRRHVSACAFAVVAVSIPLFAADGDLDPGFGGAGKLTRAYPFDGPVEDVRIAVEPGGGILAVTRIDSNSVGVVRFASDGSSDNSFGALGARALDLRTDSGTWDEFPGIHALPGGGSLVIGFWTGEDTFTPRVARLTAGGDLDSTFGGDGYVDVTGLPGTPSVDRDFEYYASAVDREGGILIAGRCTLCPANEGFEPFVLRLLADGTPDPFFSLGGWRVFDATLSDNEVAIELALDDEGRILVLGNAVNPFYQFVARLTPDGTPDSAWGSGGFSVLDTNEVGYALEAMAVDPETDAVVLAHSNNTNPGRPTGLSRLDAVGNFDESFGEAGFVDLTFDEGTLVHDLAFQSDRRIAAIGTIDGNGGQLGGFFLARTDPDGTLDDSFDGNGVKRVEFDRTTDAFDEALALALSGGRMVVAGRSTAILPPAHFALLRTESALVFTDGFESDSLTPWSAAVP